jgi:hypothetical protein
MPGRPQAPATYLCRRKVLSDLFAAFASVMGGRLSLAQARSATHTFASKAIAAEASLEKSRPGKFLIKGLQDLALLLGSRQSLLFVMPVKHGPLFGTSSPAGTITMASRNFSCSLVFPTQAMTPANRYTATSVSDKGFG